MKSLIDRFISTEHLLIYLWTALLKSLASLSQTREDCGRCWPSRVLGVNTKVCLKGPFDSAGELVHYTLHLGGRRGTQREVGEKAKDSRSCLPLALFKL